MPLNLIFTTAGNYTLDDDGIPGNNTSVIRNGAGEVIFTFVYPADDLSFTTSVPSVNVTLNLADALGAANLRLGSLTSAADSPDSIAIGKVRTTGTITLAANGAVTELGSDSGADIVAGLLAFGAGTGIGTAGNAIETQTSLIEAKTNTGGINISNFGTVQIGGVSNDVGGLQVATSGNINFFTVGTILLSDDTGTESVRGGNTSGNVTLIAKGFDSDILATADNDAIAAPGGNIVLEADRDIGFGIVGSNFDNDVRAKGSITINAGRDFLIDGFADLASDDFSAGTGGNVSITAGRNIHVRSVAGTDGSIFANGNAGADVILTTGPNGALVVDPASIGVSQPIASNSGDVIVNADRVLINSTSGIGAASGQVMIAPATAGREIRLGSASDAAFALELSDAEIDRIFTPTLTIGNDLAGDITVSSAISPANARKLVLRSGGDIAVNAGITTSGSLEIRAGDNVSTLATITVGGALSVFVDTVGNDGGIGGSVYFGGSIIGATSITIHGGPNSDTLRGVESVDQSVYGYGGNDTIISSGEGHYYGNAGDDLILAGLSSGIVPEVLNGGAGVDTLDTRSFNGSYTINLATGVTNFDYESFVNFENIITGDGNDQITGTAGKNVISSGAGNDILNGGAGADLMQGMAGNDTYFVDNAGDKVVEAAGEGNDIVYSSVTYALAAGQEVELLSVKTIADTTAINLTGNEFGQTLQGNNGANVLDGKGGADVMYGHAGNDTYFVDNAGDRVFEATGQGTDIVYTTLSYTLSAGQEVEWLSVKTIADTTAINLTGNEFGQILQGNNGANTLNGGGGADTMYGHAGNDTYFVDNGTDRVFETPGEGNDTVYTTVSYALSAGVSVEMLSVSKISATTAINLAGNDFGQTLQGNDGANTLNGRGGNDVLYGQGGNDTFVFNTALNASNNVDRIADFSPADDTIWLEDAIFQALAPGVLATAAFRIGTAAGDASDRIIYNDANGWLSYDPDGIGGQAQIHFATLNPHLALTAGDFFVA